MRKLLVLIALLVSLPFLWQAGALTLAGHGFLINKHTAKAVNCTACHGSASPPKAPEMAACLGCHGSYPQIAAKTASDQPNPHASHLGELPCSACHHVHQASVTYCDQCHAFGMNPP